MHEYVWICMNMYEIWICEVHVCVVPTFTKWVGTEKPKVNVLVDLFQLVVVHSKSSLFSPAVVAVVVHPVFTFDLARLVAGGFQSFQEQSACLTSATSSSYCNGSVGRTGDHEIMKLTIDSWDAPNFLCICPIVLQFKTYFNLTVFGCISKYCNWTL